jgi:tetratricopeptide (TPR) repeat protein
VRPLAALGIALSSSAVAAGAATAQSRELNWGRCTGADIRLSIVGCTTIISAGADTPANLATAHFNRANAYRRQGQLDLAIADYDESLRLDPTNAGALVNRGGAWAAKGMHEQAIADFDRALAINSRDALALYNRGLARRQMGDTVGGDADIAAAKAINPAIAGTGAPPTGPQTGPRR